MSETVERDPRVDPHKRCTICADPAIFHADEEVWRHKNVGFDGVQWLCEKYGYPIRVEDDREANSVVK